MIYSTFCSIDTLLNGGTDKGLWFLRNKELDMTFLNFFRVIAKIDIDLEEYLIGNVLPWILNV